MTELEKLQEVRMYIYKLANGIDPIHDTPTSESDIVNDVRLSRCFFYVTQVLDQEIQRHSKGSNKIQKQPFSITYAQLSQVPLSNTPIAISQIVRRINQQIDNEKMNLLKSTCVADWLVELGMLQFEELHNGSKVKRPTDAGFKLGLTVEHRTGPNGSYSVVLYNTSAQQFVLDNLPCGLVV
jgi:hypothetical protein